MNGHEKEMLEIVGLNGAPSIECGRALPDCEARVRRNVPGARIGNSSRSDVVLRG